MTVCWRLSLAGLLFGRDTASLTQRSLHSLLSLPEGSSTSVAALFEQDLKNGKAKRGALKTSRKVQSQVRPLDRPEPPSVLFPRALLGYNALLART